MQRHALNHTVGESTCPRCNAHFKRPDLLGKLSIYQLITLCQGQSLTMAQQGI